MVEVPLTTLILRHAYAQGFFPMPSPEGDRLLWFNPDPRAVIPLDGFHCARSLQKTLKQGIYDITFDKDFLGVMRGCADRPDTWINQQFLDVYHQMHREGFAHSVEVWRGGELVGGVYGVSLGGAFFAESKFHRARDASKVGLFHLVERLRSRGFQLLEVQFLTKHLESLGAVAWPATMYLAKLAQAVQLPVKF